jgi:hypothetical protein
MNKFTPTPGPFSSNPLILNLIYKYFLYDGNVWKIEVMLYDVD